MTARGERLDAARLYGRSSGTLSQMGRLYFADRLRSRTRTVANDQLIEARIRARAHRLWEEEGWPEGRAEAHWEQARLIVALEDAQHTMLKPVQAPEAEPIELVRNLGDFPTLTDQGEEQTKEQTYPSSSSTAGEPLFESTEPTLAAQEQLIAPPSPVGSPLTGPQVKKRGPSTAMMAAMDKPISPQLADAFFAAVREYVRWSYMGAEPGITNEEDELIPISTVCRRVDTFTDSLPDEVCNALCFLTTQKHLKEKLDAERTYATGAQLLLQIDRGSKSTVG
jgi:hypothetical protein